MTSGAGWAHAAVANRTKKKHCCRCQVRCCTECILNPESRLGQCYHRAWSASMISRLISRLADWPPCPTSPIDEYSGLIKLEYPQRCSPFLNEMMRVAGFWPCAATDEWSS